MTIFNGRGHCATISFCLTLTVSFLTSFLTVTRAPAAYQISDRDAAGQIVVKLQDWATAPQTFNSGSSSQTATQIARINFMRSDPADTSKYVVNDLNGPIYTLDKTTKTFSPYINLSTIFPNFDSSPGFAAGTVTVQFDPGFTDPSSPGYGEFYTTHTETISGGTDFRLGVLTQWKVPGDPLVNFGNPNPAVAPTHREMLEQQYQGNVHPIGDIIFNPTATPGSADYRMMYISSGDGAAGENGTTSIRVQDQMLNNYLGKVLRIQPNPLTAATAYSIPTDNPFYNQTLYPGSKQEVYAYGFRNPHRMSWDVTSNKLIVDDIGLNSFEEVNIVHPGANYGYSSLEGNQVLGTNNSVNSNPLPATLPIYTTTTSSSVGNIVPTYPVAEYRHQDPANSNNRDGDSISSGFVYHGAKIPALDGKYVFGDITTGRLFYTDYSSMLAQDAENGGHGDPTTMATIHELKVEYGANNTPTRVFDIVRNQYDLRHDGVINGDFLPGAADATTSGQKDPYGQYYGSATQSGGRSDIRWALGDDGELYLISKSDGMIRALINPGKYTGVPGDFNFDGKVTNADIQPMLDALTNVTAYKSTNLLVDADLMALGDFNHDGSFTGADIAPYLAWLANPTSVQGVPEPTSLALAICGILAASLVTRSAARRNKRVASERG